jgi:CheY-like chemotaxis protein
MATDLRVLLVDDSRIFRGALQSALEELDWVRVAGSVFSGEKALAVLETTPVDLVLLDLEMPGLSGLETLKLIQRLNGSRPPLEQAGVLIVSSQPNGSGQKSHILWGLWFSCQACFNHSRGASQGRPAGGPASFS